MLVQEPAVYPEPGEDDASDEALLHDPESNRSSLPRTPPSQKVVLFSLLPGQVHHLKWWLTKFLCRSFGYFLHV